MLDEQARQPPDAILLAVCEPALSQEAIEAVAQALRLATLHKGDRHFRIIETSREGNRVYGRCRELQELRPGIYW